MTRWPAILLLTALAAGSALEAAVPREILWIDKEHVQPMFIPADLLNEKNWDELPGSPETRSALRFEVQEAPKLVRAFGGVPAPDCPTLSDWNPDPAAYAATNFRKVLASSGIAIVGRVVDRVAGWSPYENRVVSMLYIRVSEVLRDVNGDVQRDQLVIVRELHADMNVQGTRLCVHPQPAYFVSAAGDEVLVIGQRWDGDARFIASHLLYPVSAGVVSSRAFTPIARGSVPLDLVRAAANEGRKTR